MVYNDPPEHLGATPSLPDLTGTFYPYVLARFHEVLKPQTYLEIGVDTGATLALSQCASIGIDPSFRFTDADILRKVTNKPLLQLYQMPSDAFFAAHSPTTLLGGPIDMGFLDGMHRCEYLLRDFINTEQHCRSNSLVVLHDCVPLEIPMTSRYFKFESVRPGRESMWTGDVWRTALLLKRFRPDLDITVIDAAPTGLVLITNLNPTNTALRDNYARYVRQMMTWSLEELTLPALHRELRVEPTVNLTRDEDITARFWM